MTEASMPAPDDDDLVDDLDEVEAEFDLVQEVEPELPLPVWEPTGDPAVDAALDELTRLDAMPIGDHIEVFTAVHAALHERLGELEA